MGLSHDKSLILTKATSSVSYLFCQPAYQPCLPSDFTFPSFSLRHFCLFTFQPLPFPSLPLPTISPPSPNQNQHHQLQPGSSSLNIRVVTSGFLHKLRNSS